MFSGVAEFNDGHPRLPCCVAGRHVRTATNGGPSVEVPNCLGAIHGLRHWTPSNHAANTQLPAGNRWPSVGRSGVPPNSTGLAGSLARSRSQSREPDTTTQQAREHEARGDKRGAALLDGLAAVRADNEARLNRANAYVARNPVVRHAANAASDDPAVKAMTGGGIVEILQHRGKTS